jgi:hypothetical protein
MVPALPNYATFIGTGSIGPFTFAFPFLDNSEIVAIIADPSGNIINALIASLTGAGTSTGGALTLTTALAVGYTLTIARQLPIEQQTTLPDGGPFFAATIEAALDYLTMICQQLQTVNNAQSIVVTTTPNTTTYVEIDGSTGPKTVQYSGTGELVVWRKDGVTANVVKIIPPVGWTIMGQAEYDLDVQWLWSRFVASPSSSNVQKVG